MKDEIKEILEELEDCKITKYLNYNLDNKNARIILDYITNLQEENERLIEQLENISLDEANIRADILLEQQDYKSRIDKEGVIPLSKEMEEKLSIWYNNINLKIDSAKEIEKKDKEIERLTKIEEEHRKLNGELRKELANLQNK